ncbi:MAG: DUF1587 domain-containing protein, partial [Planctomycetota bacterium]
MRYFKTLTTSFRPAVVMLGVLWVSGITCSAQSDVDPSDVDPTPADPKAEAEEFFRKHVTPFIKTYCLECHQNRRPTEAGLSFTPALDAPGHAAFSEKWKKAAARVKAHDMPPDGLDQPTDEERQMFMQWLDIVKYLSPKDPGPFVIRRLTKTEYGHTLHSLFGVDPMIADALPDEVSGAGYLNSLSPLQLEQYLAITDEVLDRVLGESVAPEKDPRTTSADVRRFRQSLQSLRRLVGENLHDLPNDGQTREAARAAVRSVAKSLARKAYRRPPSDAELDTLMEVFDL